MKCYYIIHHIDDNLPEGAQPFMENGKPTEFAERVYENIFSSHSSDDKIFEELENGNIYFSIYDATVKKIPHNALPLIEFSASEKIRINKESRSIAYSINTKKVLNGIRDLIWSLKDNPASISALFFYMLIALAGAKQFENNQKTNDDESFLNNELITQETSLEVIINNEFTLESMPDTTWKKVTHLKEKYPRLNNHEKREEFIHQAIAMDDLVRFMHAIGEGYDIKKKNADGKYTFAQAARFNAANIIHYVITVLKIDLNHFQPVDMDSSESMILMAIEKNHKPLLNLLIQWGYNLDYIISTQKNETLLHKLASQQDIHSILKIKKLIELGANINVETYTGYTPVFIAIAGNNVRAADILLKKKCNTEMEIDKQQYNLLSFALLGSSAGTIEYLLHSGFKPEINCLTKKNTMKQQTIAFPIQTAIARGDLHLLKLLFKYNSEKLIPQSAFELITLSLSTGQVDPAYFILKRIDSDHEVIYMIMMNELKNKIANDSLADKFFETYKDWIIINKRNLFNSDEARKFARKKTKMEIEDLEIPQLVSLCEEFTFEEYYVIAKIISDYLDKHPTVNTFFHLITGFLSAVLSAKILKTIYEIGYDIYSRIFRARPTKPLIITSPEQIEEVKKNILAFKKEKTPKTIKVKKEVVQIIPPKQAIESDIIAETIKACRKEKDIFLDNDRCLMLFNKSNSYLSNYKQFTVIESCRRICLEYNENIKRLHNIARYIKEELIKQAPFIGNNGMTLLNLLEQQLEKLDPSKMLEVDLIKKQIIQIHDAQIDLKRYEKESKDLIEWICDSKDSIELELKNNPITEESKHEVISKKTVDIRKKLEIKKEGSNKDVSCDKNVGWAKRSSAQPNIEIQNSPTIISKKSKKEKTTVTCSTNLIIPTNQFFKIDQTNNIMQDDRIIYANQLKMLMENILEDAKKDNRHKIYAQDAMFYLLMKLSHLMSQIAYKYKCIVILPSAQDLYHLRSNIIHYPEHCFKNSDIHEFFEKFYQLFYSPLSHLEITGSCCNIDMKDLYNICPFIMDDHRNDIEINHTSNNFNTCLTQIKRLCDITSQYYEIGRNLHRDSKFEHEGVLHSAMHAIILQFRKTLKILRKHNFSLFQDIYNQLPYQLIEKGNHSAHNTVDVFVLELPLEQRKYFDREDIHYKTLLDLMRDIDNEKENILTIIDKYLLDNKINNRQLSAMKL